MVEEARLDMEGEGFGMVGLKAELEFVISDEKRRENMIQVTCPVSLTEGDLANTIPDCLKKASLGPNADNLIIEIVRLRVRAPLSKLEPIRLPNEGEDPKASVKGERNIWRGSEIVPTTVYEWDKLRTGNVVQGPAVIEGTDTTYIVPRGWELVMDPFLNAVISRRG
jgi:N-methylhydantoinase A/oxoprolinase/acetone carboxylase beta subunit